MISNDRIPLVIKSIAFKLMLVLKHELKFIFGFTKNIFSVFLFLLAKEIIVWNRKYEKMLGTFRLQNDSC